MSSLNLSEITLPRASFFLTTPDLSFSTIILASGIVILSLFSLVLWIANRRGLDHFQKKHAFKSLLLSMLASVIPPLAIILFIRTARYVLTVDPAK
ncbi:hypothetical protein GCM10009425_40280 [Pseudomonas asuensis]|uniref:Uncharacterized protein n=1 Tax=Pseudomonas asuensis TaxID=1825787 RepID=A0ABQ2H2P5_9PSED|nr:hypothetical protein GCM10009425_40280 [Pseudomonas asuensis]